MTWLPKGWAHCQQMRWVYRIVGYPGEHGRLLGMWNEDVSILREPALEGQWGASHPQVWQGRICLWGLQGVGGQPLSPE